MSYILKWDTSVSVSVSDFDFEESLRLGLCGSLPPGLSTVGDMNVRLDHIDAMMITMMMTMMMMIKYLFLIMPTRQMSWWQFSRHNLPLQYIRCIHQRRNQKRVEKYFGLLPIASQNFEHGILGTGMIFWQFWRDSTSNFTCIYLPDIEARVYFLFAIRQTQRGIN